MGWAAKLTFGVSILVLFLYFSWASLLIQWISPWANTEVTRFIRWQDIALFDELSSLLDSSPYGLTQIVADFEALAALLVLLASTASLSGGAGPGRALLRTLQVGSFCSVVFGMEIALFNYGFFYVHVTDAQLAYDVIPWFSNADMLLCGLLVFGATTMLTGRRSWRRNSLEIVALAVLALTAVGAAAASQSNAVASSQAASVQSSTQDSSVASSFHTSVEPSGSPVTPLIDTLVNDGPDLPTGE